MFGCSRPCRSSTFRVVLSSLFLCQLALLPLPPDCDTPSSALHSFNPPCPSPPQTPSLTMAASRTIPGAPSLPQPTKKQQAAARKNAAVAPPTHKGLDPAATTVEAPVKAKVGGAGGEGGAGGRPDKGAYDAEQDELRSQIDALQLKQVRPSLLPFSSSFESAGTPSLLSSLSLIADVPAPLSPTYLHRDLTPAQNDLKNKISASSPKSSPEHERKLAVRKELDALRGEQAARKGGRGKTLDGLKKLQEEVGKKVRFFLFFLLCFSL